jgi:hypothetical protein
MIALNQTPVNSKRLQSPGLPRSHCQQTAMSVRSDPGKVRPPADAGFMRDDLVRCGLLLQGRLTEHRALSTVEIADLEPAAAQCLVVPDAGQQFVDGPVPPPQRGPLPSGRQILNGKSQPGSLAASQAHPPPRRVWALPLHSWLVGQVWRFTVSANRCVLGMVFRWSLLTPASCANRGQSATAAVT